MNITDFRLATDSVTRAWTRQRKREERQQSHRNRRDTAIHQRRKINIRDIVFGAIPDAYDRASSGSTLPASTRQIYYQIRDVVSEMSGKTLEAKYFEELLPEYMDSHDCGDWDVTHDARGAFHEPHTGKMVPLGTLDVRSYLRSRTTGLAGYTATIPTYISMQYPTNGPHNRYGAVLFIEKEGFHPLFKSVGLANRFDVAIMSTKGMSNISSRQLVDAICKVGAGVPVFILHDFDIPGLRIAQTLVEVSPAMRKNNAIKYEFENEIDSVDFGLRLEDIREWNLASESTTTRGEWPEGLPAMEAEKEFLLSGRRVELNAFTSADFIAWIENKLEEHGVRKVIPDDETLATAYRRVYQIDLMNRKMGAVANEARKLAEKVTIPSQLKKQIEDVLAQTPSMAWDDAMAGIVTDRSSD